MLALTLTLTVLGGPAAPPTPDLHLVPRLEMAAPAVPGLAAPALDLETAEATAPLDHDARVARALAGVLVADGIAGGLFFLGFITSLGEVWASEGESSGGWNGFYLTGAGTTLLLTPAMAVAFASDSATPRNARWRAYAKAFGARALAFAVAYGMAETGSRELRGLGMLAFTVNELAVVPWIVASTVRPE